MPRPKSESIKDFLRTAIVTSMPMVPAQFDQVEWQFVYVPERHLRALETDTMLVTGVRGAGKSFWWYLLQQNDYREALLGPQITISVGFGQGADASRPEKDELQQLLELGYNPRLIWKAVVLRQIAPHLTPFTDWRQLVNWVTENPSPSAAAFREFDAKLIQDRLSHIVLFDALDRTADNRKAREQLLSGLLQLVLELRGYRALRAKVFARPDMLEAPEVKNFPDASKVFASGTNLEWRIPDLYGLLFQYLGNASDKAAAAVFRDIAGGAVDEPLWLVPKALRNDEDRQQKIFETIAGQYMGKNRRRGKTYTWVPNHLSDAAGKVSPRSFLAAIRKAAEEPTRHEYALDWSGIEEGVRYASRIRVGEIQEDLPWAHEAMKLLEDLAVPCDRSKIMSVWRSGNLLKNRLKGLPEDLDSIMGELNRIGIFKVLPDGRINIPDVYRLGFGLRRKGSFAPRR